MVRGLFIVRVGMLKCWITAGDIKLSVAPLSTRASTSEIMDEDRRLIGAQMDRSLGIKMAWGNRARSMAVCFGPSKNLSPCHSSLEPIVRVGLQRAGPCEWLGMKHCRLRYLRPFLLLL